MEIVYDITDIVRKRLRSRSFLAPRYRRKIRKVIRFFLISLLTLVVCAFIPPARNLIGYFVLPGAWRELSSFRIIHLYFADPVLPVEETQVTCESVQKTMAKVQWKKIESEIDKFPVYDLGYFQKIRDNLDEYGTSESDLDLFEKQYFKFKPSMTPQWQREMAMTFRMFVHVMEVFNMSYFMSEGSMLGSYRHHGFIPWDDDMDIVMNGTDWLKVKRILHCIPNFDVNTENNMMYKFFWNKSPLWAREDFIRFPFIDIFFFNEDKEYLWAMTGFKKNRIVFKKKDIFPLVHRPYHGMIVPVPGNIDKICTTVYNPDTCVSRDFDHLGRHFLKFYEVEYIPCSTFSRIYPFVVRKDAVIKGRKATIEYLKIGKKIISNYTVFH